MRKKEILDGASGFIMGAFLFAARATNKYKKNDWLEVRRDLSANFLMSITSPVVVTRVLGVDG